MIDRNAQTDLLARAYALILSWTDPPEKEKTAVSRNFDGTIETAVEKETDSCTTTGSQIPSNSTTMGGGK